MSAKGCGPNNAAAEGFLGGPGSGFLHGRDWKGVGYEEFRRRLAACPSKKHTHPFTSGVSACQNRGVRPVFHYVDALGRHPATRAPPVRTGLASDAILRKNFGITTVLYIKTWHNGENDEGNVNNEACRSVLVTQMTTPVHMRFPNLGSIRIQYRGKVTDGQRNSQGGVRM